MNTILRLCICPKDDTLSRIDNGEPSTGVYDQLPHANLFCMDILEEEDDHMEETEQTREKIEQKKEDVTPCLE